MPNVASLGDPGSHGGSIVTASPDTVWNGRRAARVGDTYACPIHGPNPIVTGSSDIIVNGRRLARVGDRTACGASIVAGAMNIFANGSRALDTIAERSAG